jgi:hypothetical protein
LGILRKVTSLEKALSWIGVAVATLEIMSRMKEKAGALKHKTKANTQVNFQRVRKPASQKFSMMTEIISAVSRMENLTVSVLTTAVLTNTLENTAMENFMVVDFTSVINFSILEPIRWESLMELV